VPGIGGTAGRIVPALHAAGLIVVDYHAQSNIFDTSAQGMLCWTADIGPTTPPTCTTGKRVAWQFSWTGSIPGVSAVDESISYGLLKLAVPRLVCFPAAAAGFDTPCMRIVAHYAWLIRRRDYWLHEFNRCILYADGIGCEHSQHWAIVRGQQAAKLRKRYTAA
jgi:hypothetical protein